MEKSKQIEEIAIVIKEVLPNSLPKMYHPTDDLISIPLIVDNKKIIIEIKSIN
jgi:hypothetical protein